MELVVRSEVFHVVQDLIVLIGCFFTDLFFFVPRVVKAVRDRLSLSRVVGEHFFYRVLSFLGNALPVFLREGKLAFQNFLENNLVVGAVKRRVAAQQYVHNNPDGPDIALFSVMLVNDFGGDIVRSTLDFSEV